MKTLTRLKEAIKPVLPPGIPEPSIIVDIPQDTTPGLTLPMPGMTGNGKGKGKASQQRNGQFPPLHLGPMGMGGPNGMMHGMPPGMHPGMGMGGRPSGPPLKKGQKRSMNGMPQGMMSGMGIPPGGGPQMDWRPMMPYPPGAGTASTGTTPTPPPPSR